MFVNIDNKKIYKKSCKHINGVYKHAVQFTSTNRNDKYKYIDVPVSIDIETTTTETHVFPYIYMFGINGICYATRYKETFIKFLKYINNTVKKLNCVQVIFIHNLNYELTFFNGYFCGKFKTFKVFATDKNKALYVQLENLKIIDTLRLVNMSLEKMATNYNLKHQKLKGDLDYSKYRNCTTELTPVEKHYCANDVLILNDYWNVYKQYTVTSKNLFRIIYTSTSVTRLEIQKNIKNRIQTARLIYDVNNNTSDEIKQMLIDCYCGAFVKSNNHLTNKIIEHVKMFDYVSAYIGVMLTYKYPSYKFEKIEDNLKIDDIINDSENNGYLIDIEIKDLKNKCGFSTISFHKTTDIKGYILDNGRILQASYIRLRITEIDLICLKMFYNFDMYRIQAIYKSRKEYLPKYLLKTIEKLYTEKQIMKKQKNRDEQMYLHLKSKLNALYGCMVEKSHDIEYIYNNATGEYTTQKSKKHEKTFLLRQWGVYVTAYSRYNLLSTISKIENIQPDSVIYTDTDSIKINNYNVKIENIIQQENVRINKLVHDNCKKLNLNYEILKDIGLWDGEPDAKLFVTKGSKKYMYYDNDDNIHITISGINKKSYKKYCDITNTNYIDSFLNDIFIIPKQFTNKYSCEYNILPKFMKFNDDENEIKGYVRLKPVDFTLKIDDEYSLLLQLLDENQYISGDIV